MFLEFDGVPPGDDFGSIAFSLDWIREFFLRRVLFIIGAFWLRPKWLVGRPGPGPGRGGSS